MIRSTALLVVLASSATALAEGGELYVAPVVGVEMANLAHDVHPDGSRGEDFSAAWALLPRFGAELRYGLTDELRAGLALTYAWSTEAKTAGLVIAGLHGDLYADYRDISLPLTLSYLVSRGGLGLALTVGGGISFVRWKDSKLLRFEPATGQHVELPFVRRTTDEIAVFGSVAVLGQLRPLDWLALDFGPYVQARRLGDRITTHVGLGLNSSLIFGVGPRIAAPELTSTRFNAD